MSGNLKSRVSRIEKAKGIRTRHTYLAVIGLFDDEERDKGYLIQPATLEAGGTGGEPFRVRGKKALDAFCARPDVNLKIVNFTSNERTNENED